MLEVVSASDHRGKLGRLSLGNQDLQVQDLIRGVPEMGIDSLRVPDNHRVLKLGHGCNHREEEFAFWGLGVDVLLQQL